MSTRVSATHDDFDRREFPMSDSDFRFIQQFAYTHTGINLLAHKKNMIYGRLTRRLRKLNMTTFKEYCRLLQESPRRELEDFVNAITTNLTSFFREVHHFDYLQQVTIPHLKQTCAGNRRVRIWSAGCSSGEEPYSIAMVFHKHFALDGWDFKILATDLDSNVVHKAKTGQYPADFFDRIPPVYKDYFRVDEHTGNAVIDPRVRSLITFKTLNLLQAWPMKGPFDVIFCRNVVIYFDIPTQKVLFERYANILKDSGTLFIGHSENLYNITKRFVSKGRTIYEKVN